MDLQFIQQYHTEEYDEARYMLKEIHSETENHPLTYVELENMIDDHIAWITWNEIRDIVKAQMESFSSDSESTTNSIRRVCNELIRAVERHGE